MAKTKVKRDEHGLYIRAAGYIWRYDFPLGRSHVHGQTPTVFSEGDEVSVSHSGGPLASIRSANAREHWFAHGSYLKRNGGFIPSNNLYRPNYHFWG